jgi:GTP-binding protein
MDLFVRQRCLAHVTRSRILRLRHASTATTTPPPPTRQTPPSASPPTTSSSPAPAKDITPPKPIALQRYHVSTPPTSTQQTYATRYFQNPSSPPLHLWTAAKFSQIPRSPYPEVCFVGRSNVGKSSLLNAVFGRPKEKIARVSSKAGHTKTLNAFGVGGNSRDVAAKEALKQLQQGALVVVDTPGYGYHSRQEWGPEINKFFEKRKQLRMVFLLIDALHGVKPRDLVLLQHFEMQGIPYQIILSKVDRIVMTDSKVPGPEKLGRQVAKLDKVYEEIEEQLATLDQGKRRKKRDVLAASAEKQIKGLQGWGGGAKIGIEAVRWAVLKACGLDCDEQGQRRVVESFQIQDEEEGDEEVVAWRPQN